MLAVQTNAVSKEKRSLEKIEWFLFMATSLCWIGEKMWLFLRICKTIRIVYHFDFQEIDQHNRVSQNRLDRMDNEGHRKNWIESEYSKSKLAISYLQFKFCSNIHYIFQ